MALRQVENYLVELASVSPPLALGTDLQLEKRIRIAFDGGSINVRYRPIPAADGPWDFSPYDATTMSIERDQARVDAIAFYEDYRFHLDLLRNEDPLIVRLGSIDQSLASLAGTTGFEWSLIAPREPVGEGPNDGTDVFLEPGDRDFSEAAWKFIYRGLRLDE